jgi:hypothetical protein
MVCNDAAEMFKNEATILEKVRQHLREAAGNRAIKRLSFHFDFTDPKPGGPRSVRHDRVEVDVHYTYLENSSAV